MPESQHGERMSGDDAVAAVDLVVGKIVVEFPAEILRASQLRREGRPAPRRSLRPLDELTRYDPRGDLAVEDDDVGAVFKQALSHQVEVRAERSSEPRCVGARGSASSCVCESALVAVAFATRIAWTAESGWASALLAACLRTGCALPPFAEGLCRERAEIAGLVQRAPSEGRHGSSVLPVKTRSAEATDARASAERASAIRQRRCWRPSCRGTSDERAEAFACAADHDAVRGGR